MATDWHVDYQDERPDIRSNGQMTRVRDVHFTVDTEPGAGQTGTVTVEDVPGYADKARALIEAKVAEIKSLHQ
jgi:hypothetical protein